MSLASSPLPTWRRALLRRAGSALLASCALLLGACGTADDSGNAHLRLLNASPGYASLDLYIDSSESSSDVATGSAGGYVSLDTDSHTVAVRRSGTVTNLVSTDRTLAKDSDYTLVAYGWEGSLKTALLTDEESAPSSGVTKVRVFNTATDAGSLDVYLTDADTVLTDTSPVASSVAGAGISDYVELSAGSSWRLRVTGAGDSTDVRLDLSGLSLGSAQVVTLLLTPSDGGVLVHALLVAQGGSTTVLTNTQARVRLVAGTTDKASHSAVVGSSTLTSATASPSVGAYKLVSAGSALALDLQVNGSRLSTTSLSLSAGADVTLLVHGSSAAPELAVISDNNRLPTSSSQAKVRLVNGVYNLGSGLSLTLDYLDIASGITAGGASSYALVTASTGSLMTADAGSTQLCNSRNWTDSLTIAAKSVLTQFVLGDASSPTCALKKDR